MSGVTINEIDATIKKLTGKRPNTRPFLCQGSPIGSKVFLVGERPGTDTPFWRYWGLPDGCDKDGWIKAYLKIHGRYYPTRARIESLFENIGPAKTLETNVFSSSSLDDSDTRLFDYLLAALRPALLFIHGKPAREHFERVAQTSLPKVGISEVTLDRRKVKVITGPHLRLNSAKDPAVGWTKDRVEALGREIRGHVQPRPRI